MLNIPSEDTVGNMETAGFNVLGKLGSLEVRIAANVDEIAQALAVHRQVFTQISEDGDVFDAHCDHLIVLDNALSNSGPTGKVVATYRLLRQENTSWTNGFYTASEFEIEPLLARHTNLDFLEFGRSCVLSQYRGKRTLELLWHGSWAYVRQNAFDVMFGCASFDGNKVERHREALSFLVHNAAPDKDWQVAAASGKRLSLDIMEAERIDLRRTMRSMPPLIKGYLRLGAMFCAEPVIDHEFGTIDVLVLLPVSRLNPKYVNYYGSNAERFASG